MIQQCFYDLGVPLFDDAARAGVCGHRSRAFARRAFGSLPLSSSRATTFWQYSASPHGYPPMAHSKGVLPLLVLALGSAPCSSRTRITSEFAFFPAKWRGVSPSTSYGVNVDPLLNQELYRLGVRIHFGGSMEDRSILRIRHNSRRDPTGHGSPPHTSRTVRVWQGRQRLPLDAEPLPLLPRSATILGTLSIRPVLQENFYDCGSVPLSAPRSEYVSGAREPEPRVVRIDGGIRIGAVFKKEAYNLRSMFTVFRCRL